MKVLNWLKKLFRGKDVLPEEDMCILSSRAEGLKIIDAQHHIHTKEKI